MIEGDLKVWWVPEVPGNAFEVPVTNLIEAKLLLDAFANYDDFRLEHGICDDYSNAGGLLVFEGGEWLDWESADGDDIDHLTLEELRGTAKCDG
jgi:hypothetical protein